MGAVLNTVKQTISAMKTACVQLGLIAVFLLAFSSVSLAGTFVAFGPQDYIRATGKPTPVITSFTVLNPHTTYTLRIDNGGLNGEFTRVPSAVVTVNGIEIVSPSDFNQNVSVIEKSVTLANENELVVEVRSKPGSGFALQIIGVDDDPPTITATADPPPNAAGWNNTNVTVSFDCSDSTSGIASCPEPVVVQTEGANQVIGGTAEDNAGNTATASVTVNLDKTPPSLSPTIDPPANSDGWNNTNVTVSFEATDGLSGIASVTDPVTLAEEGAAQVVSGTATDVAGNSTTASATVNLDTTPPSLSSTIDPPPNSNGWNNTDVTVSFQAADSLSGIASVTDPITLTTDGVGQEVSGMATDQAGNTATTSATVNFDKTAPIIQITSPGDGTTLNTSPVTVTGTISDDLSGIVSATCNGLPLALSDSAFTCDVSLTEGANLINVQATDLAGNTSASSITVTFAPIIPPVVNITAPANLNLFNISPIVVSGTVDERAVAVAVNGIPATLSNGTWTAEIPLEEGNNTITAVAQDATGNVGTASIQVTLDTTPPRVSIDSPADGFVAITPSITVAGMINDIVAGTINGDKAQVTVNGIAAAIANRSFLATNVPLSLGPNTITATGTDQAGNTTSTSIAVQFVQPAGKQIELISGQSQTAQIQTTLPEPLTVRLVDENNSPVADKNVVFRVLLGDGAVGVGTPEESQAIVVVSDTSGIVSTQFRLGSRAGNGNHRVRAKAVGFEGEAIFYASADPNPGDKINVLSGNNQRGVIDQSLPQPLVVAVTDVGANLIPNAQVEFKVTQGGGQFQNEGTVFTAQTDSDGRASAQLTLGPEVGLDVQRVAATLVGTSAFAGFTASGFVSGDPGQTSISGVVLDNQDNPVPGVTIQVDGTALQAVAGVEGQFKITQAPVGAVHLIADGSTATVAGDWPTLSYNLVTVAGADNPLPAPIYMVKLDTANAMTVGAEDVEYTLPEVPGFKLMVKAGSVTFPDGSKEGQISVTTVNANKVPMPPPNGMQPQFIVTIQPAGAIFDPPAPLTLPNVDGHPPGAQVEMYSYDHDLEEFVTIGVGTVSPDGAVIESDPGVGVLKAGWHCGSQPGGTGCLHNCPQCLACEAPDCICNMPTPAEPCDDGNECTFSDICDGPNCRGIPNPGASCDDGNECTTNDTCSGTSCSPGDPVADGTSCDNACTTGGMCFGGFCDGGTPQCMDDGDVCNGTERCDPILGCQSGLPPPDGTPCDDDGNQCTTDICQNGACFHLAIQNCNDADGDGVPDDQDTDPNDPNKCGDSDGDTCDDCISGMNDPAHDGSDLDLDGLCDAGDPDMDGDGIPNDQDDCPQDPENQCENSLRIIFPAPGAILCAAGQVIVRGTSFGPSEVRVNGIPATIALDTPQNPWFATLTLPSIQNSVASHVITAIGLLGGQIEIARDTVTVTIHGPFTECDFDRDGVVDVEDSDPDDPNICTDSEEHLFGKGDGCDDCSNGRFDPANDGSDSDSDTICDSSLFNSSGDNCNLTPNPDQRDDNLDRIGDACQFCNGVEPQIYLEEFNDALEEAQREFQSAIDTYNTVIRDTLPTQGEVIIEIGKIFVQTAVCTSIELFTVGTGQIITKVVCNGSSVWTELELLLGFAVPATDPTAQAALAVINRTQNKLLGLVFPPIEDAQAAERILKKLKCEPDGDPINTLIRQANNFNLHLGNIRNSIFRR